jgi:DNA-binding MarR family transcriptional regulator
MLFNLMLEKDLFRPIESVVCLARRMENIADKYVFKPMGISSINMKILKALKWHVSLSPSDLIEITNSTKSNISQRLNFLEKEGSIRRNYASDKNDKRKVQLQLTTLGRKKLAVIEKRFEKAHISFSKRFSVEELAQHKLFMQKINTILDKEEDELKKLFKN